MSRLKNKEINDDREIIDLRMQAEDLINNIDQLSDEDYKSQAQMIKQKIDQRIAEILTKP